MNAPEPTEAERAARRADAEAEFIALCLKYRQPGETVADVARRAADAIDVSLSKLDSGGRRTGE